MRDTNNAPGSLWGEWADYLTSPDSLLLHALLAGASVAGVAAALAAPLWLAICLGALTMLGVVVFLAFALDHCPAWNVLVVLTRLFCPFRGLNKYMTERLLGVGPLLYGVHRVEIDTAAVNGGTEVLRGKLLSPAGQPGPFPTVLMRTPYNADSEPLPEVLAALGYAVLVQDTRGRFGSEGQFVPVQHEVEDGAATIEWIKEQSWYNGKLAAFGVSYLGFTAWACVGGKAGAELSACGIVISQSRLRSAVFPSGGGFAFELVVLWLFLVLRTLVDLSLNFADRHAAWETVCRARRWLRDYFVRGLPHAAMDGALRVPVDLLVKRFTGGLDLPFWHEVLSDPEPCGTFWQKGDVLCDFQGCVPPLHICTSWHDFFGDEALRDFGRAREAGQGDVTLTIFGGGHWDIACPSLMRVMWKGTLQLFEQRLKGQSSGASADGSSGDHEYLPVLVQLMGTGAWVRLPCWPPPPVPFTPLFLTGTGALSWTRPPPAASAREYVYRPDAPTPFAGGKSFSLFNCGVKSQRRIEKRSDLLLYTTPPLTASFDVLGYCKLVVFITAGNSPKGAAPPGPMSVDVIGRLCTVTPRGTSTNICEGLQRLSWEQIRDASGGAMRVEIDLGATGCRFSPGDRIRLHVCSAAHPRLMRNPGHGFDGHIVSLKNSVLQEIVPPIAVQVHSDAQRPSQLELPLLGR